MFVFSDLIDIIEKMSFPATIWVLLRHCVKAFSMIFIPVAKDEILQGLGW